MGIIGSTGRRSHERRRTLMQACALEARALAAAASLPTLEGTHELTAFVAADGWSARDRLLLEAVQQPFGGVRWWCRCNQCGARRRAVYALPGRSELRCRRCWGLAYHSQRLAPADRVTHRALSLARRLGMEIPAGMISARVLPSKPAKMHWSTYERQVGRIRTLLDSRQELLLAEAVAFLNRVRPGWQAK